MASLSIDVGTEGLTADLHSCGHEDSTGDDCILVQITTAWKNDGRVYSKDDLCIHGTLSSKREFIALLAANVGGTIQWAKVAEEVAAEVAQ